MTDDQMSELDRQIGVRAKQEDQKLKQAQFDLTLRHTSEIKRLEQIQILLEKFNQTQVSQIVVSMLLPEDRLKMR